MDIGKAFSYVVSDKDWVKKVVIGGILGIIPIANLIVMGYGLRVLKNVSQDDPQPLPEWDDWGGDFVKGLMVTLAGLIYSSPAIVLAAIFALIGVVAGFAGNAPGEAQGVFAVLMVCFTWLMMLWGLAVGLWMPAAMVNYTDKWSFGAMFAFEKIWTLISENIGNYVTVLAVMLLAGIAAIFGIIGCVIGVLFTQFYAQLVSMHALGQFAREAGRPTVV